MTAVARVPMYHRATLELLDDPPSFSAAAIERVEARERALGIRLPESVREWYSLDQPIPLLEIYSNDDHPHLIESLGEPEWFEDLVQMGILVFMHEHQICCRWAVAMDGSDDPSVMISDEMPEMLRDGWSSSWSFCADQFSTFVYSRVWDYRNIHYAACHLSIKMPADFEVEPALKALSPALTSASSEAMGWADFATQESYRCSPISGAGHVLVERLRGLYTNCSFGADSFLDLARLVTPVWYDGVSAISASLTIRCQPGVTAHWSTDSRDTKSETTTVGKLILEVCGSGRPFRWTGPFDEGGSIIVTAVERARVRGYACVGGSEDEPPKSPKAHLRTLSDGSKVWWFTN